MRSMILAMMTLAACSTATPAGAQANAAATTSYVGTWGFQSEDYGTDDYGAMMSGVAVIAQGAGTRYQIRLLAQELLTQRESGETRLLVAHENCTGDGASGQFTITCQMAEPLQGYQPDTFLLQPGENADQLVGAMTSASSGGVTFNRMR
jgi:hypothetical protein